MGLELSDLRQDREKGREYLQALQKDIQACPVEMVIGIVPFKRKGDKK